MANWKVTTGDMVFEEKDGEVSCNDSASNYLFEQRGRYYFTSIDYAPLATYESTGPDDATAVFLNAMLYTPGDKTIEGEPPVPVPSWPCRYCDENDATDGPDLPQDDRDMVGKGDPTLDRPDDAEIGILFGTLVMRTSPGKQNKT